MATTDSLRGARCAPGAPRLGDAEQRALMGGIASWGTDGASLERRLKVNDFKTALALVNQIGALAEAEGHHPDLGIFSWNNVRISLSTHDAGGLTRNDFIMAAKIDALIESHG